MAKNESEFAVHQVIDGQLVSVLPGEDFPSGFAANDRLTKPAKDDDDDEKPAAPRRGRAAKGSDES